jgi:phosphoribosylaminoimidazole-succinocarboxamide synthase
MSAFLILPGKWELDAIILLFKGKICSGERIKINTGGGFIMESVLSESRLLYKGKSKSMYAGDDDRTCILEYRDSATAGNGAKKAELEGKGALNAEISYILYKYLEENGIETHFIKMLDKTRMLVKKVDIINVEVIVRNIAAGGFSKKYGIPEGTPLKNTVVEFCLKSDEYGDPMMNESQITALGLAAQDQLESLKNTALRINSLLSSLFDKCGITLVDFKLEFGMYEGRIILADEISPDSCRFWDKATGDKMDKDRFRRDLGDVLGAYREVLRRLKDAQ